MTMPQRWRLRPAPPEQVEALAEACAIHPLVAHCLVAREVSTPEDAQAMLEAPLEALHDPFAMRDMDRAVERLLRAIADGERIAVYGDYDVDGITATALLVTFLRECGVEASWRLSNRFTEGYGMHTNAVDELVEDGVALIVTADMGISHAEEVAYAAERGADTIVTDHHEAPPSLPPAVAVLNPKRPDCTYPYKGLAGVGVVFKLVTALRRELHKEGFFGDTPPNLKRHADLFALGTVADVVPLTGENHLLVKRGLEELSTTSKVGLRALKQVAGLEGKRITAGGVGFILAPRLNAVGRLGDAALGVELLLAERQETALKLARRLEQENRRRQSLQKAIFEEALGLVDEDGPLPAAIVLASDEWHQGVIGIVASKLAERYWRPTMLISLDGALGKGSARSIPRLNLYEALSRCSALLEEFGGHRAAAGCTIAAERIEAFREAFTQTVATMVEPDGFEPELLLDDEVPLEVWSIDLIRSLEALEPFGPGNPSPTFATRGVAVHGEPKWVGKDRKHLKMGVSDGSSALEVIGFQAAGKLPAVELSPGTRVDIAYQPQVNRWNNQDRIQLKLISLKPSEGGAG
ncbi:MAG: single-stranded-DNA-specific exonuclease RecJ [bacterium]|nr:single-stranded-DNA-specific exonuclease RecJ [bacterium]